MNETERKMIAYHEAGHTIAGLVLSDARVVHKVTIVPRGRAGGYAIMLPKEDRYLMTEKDLTEQIVGLLGGRVAEELFFGAQSSGASNDFQQATKLARSMVTEYGMSEKLGPVQYEGSNDQVFMGRDYGQTKAFSERIAYEIDQEVRRIINEGHGRATDIIKEHGQQLKIIAEHLLEYETLNEIEIKSLFEDGEMPSRDPESDEFPREDKDEEDSIGVSYDEIKKAHEERVEAMEEEHEEQLTGRKTIGMSDVDESEEDSDEETKTEKDPDDVDVEELSEDSDDSDESDDEDEDKDNNETE